jgi:hypothetical protein
MIDLEKLFQQQIEQENASMLYMVLKDGDFETLHRRHHDEKVAVIDMLKEYKYLDTRIGIPRFEKKAKRNAAKTT